MRLGPIFASLRLKLSTYARIWLWIGLAALFLGSFLIVTSEVQETLHGEKELIGRIDGLAEALLSEVRSPRMSTALVDITALGSATVVSIFVISAGLLLAFKRQYRSIVHLATAAAGAGLLTRALKSYFERDRPVGLAHLVDVQGYSYPSGHSLTGAAVYFTFAILLSDLFPSTRKRAIVVAMALVLILLIGLSRVYLGVHYFSDVLAGLLFGIGWAACLGAARSYLEVRSASHGTD